ncbi:hypothetical protein LEP1GSC051_3758 [Leptospira sp. P2653]|nr:hypothetical protein LEP1GSC051_3758 [Leptospira sp. P2653]
MYRKIKNLWSKQFRNFIGFLMRTLEAVLQRKSILKQIVRLKFESHRFRYNKFSLKICV